jgi:methyl-accepting chemotaxis protein
MERVEGPAAAALREGALVSPIASKYRRLWMDYLPVLVALAIITVYFLAVIPNSSPYWWKYILTMAVLLVISRIPNIWYYKRAIIRPIAEYKRRKKTGQSISRADLQRYYWEFAASVPRIQIMAFWTWIGASIGLALSSYFWIQHSWVAVVGCIFIGLIAMTIHLSFAYFLNKRNIRPLLEEVAGRLEVLQDVSKYRLALGYKIAVSIMGFMALALASFGLVIYTRLSMALSEITLGPARPHAVAAAASLESQPEEQWPRILREQASELWTLVVTDRGGKPLAGLASGPFDRTALPEGLDPSEAIAPGQEVGTIRGTVQLYPLKSDRLLILMGSSSLVDSVMRRTSLFGLLFLLATLLIFGAYVWWLGKDIGGTLHRAAEANERLARGDLTSPPSLWSDDELGSMAENMRKTFQSLAKMVREVVGASSVVEEEVARTLGVTENLQRQVASQAYFADKTKQSAQVMEERLMQMFLAMEHVARSTQDVSSAILQMQASVEEIARNAEVLTQSVEKTAASSTEISTSATEVQGATDRLHDSAQEAVSFLTEQDAALEETRRGAGGLSETASQVTKDAEAGFTAVVAVEEEILRTKRASEQSRSALADLHASIEKIGRIVDVIQDVTEQTNLLSLNASIIAAGAGEHGKPFAVVATQIRELSARTAGNAKEIRTVIRSLTSSGDEMAASMERTFEVVSRSSDLSRGAGEALRTILESASSQEEMCKRIAAATDELAHGGQSANRAMHHIFEMVEGIAKAVREQATSTRYLNEEAERIREVARQLKNATDEQAKGARVIGDAVRRISEDTRQSNQAAQTQAEEAKAIFESMRQVAETAQAIEKAFSDLAETAGHLQKSADGLKREVRAFRT